MATQANPRIPGSAQHAMAHFPTYVDAKALAAGVAESFTVPDNANVVLLSGATAFYAKLNDTAAVPADTADGTASLYIASSGWFAVVPGDTISVLSVAGGVVTAAWY